MNAVHAKRGRVRTNPGDDSTERRPGAGLHQLGQEGLTKEPAETLHGARGTRHSSDQAIEQSAMVRPESSVGHGLSWLRTDFFSLGKVKS